VGCLSLPSRPSRFVIHASHCVSPTIRRLLRSIRSPTYCTYFYPRVTSLPAFVARCMDPGSAAMDVTYASLLPSGQSAVLLLIRTKNLHARQAGRYKGSYSVGCSAEYGRSSQSKELRRRPLHRGWFSYPTACCGHKVLYYLRSNTSTRVLTFIFQQLGIRVASFPLDRRGVNQPINIRLTQPCSNREMISGHGCRSLLRRRTWK